MDAGGEGEMTGWFFDRPCGPGEEALLADEVAAWLCSPSLRWLVDNVPGRREPGGPVVPLGWPGELCEESPAGGGVAGLARVLAAFADVCDWSRPGTAWDHREQGERRLGDRSPAPSDALAAEVGRRAEELGLRSRGALRTRAETFVVLGGRRLAPLNRARAAARALRRTGPGSPRVVMLCGERPLEPDERDGEEVRSYAPGARTEVDLMRAAARQAFDPTVDVGLVEVPAPAGRARASTYDTLRALAEFPELTGGGVAIATSPTCRPFQCLEAVRALGLPLGVTCELIAHPPAWAAASPARWAPPHVYLQEIRSTIQAAGRLAAALTDAGADLAPAAALA